MPSEWIKHKVVLPGENLLPELIPESQKSFIHIIIISNYCVVTV